MRPAGKAILGSVALFVCLGAISMAVYPGGSWLERTAQRHDLLRNFLCDLLGPVAINGAPNTLGSAAMIAGMVILALGLGITWWSVPAMFEGSRLGLAIRSCGAVSLVGLVAVPLTPPTVSYTLHAAAVFTGGGPAFAAWALCVFGLTRDRRTRPLGLLGAVALAFIGLGFGLYAQQYFFGGGLTILLPVSHRVATVLVLSWLVAVAVRMKKSPVALVPRLISDSPDGGPG